MIFKTLSQLTTFVVLAGALLAAGCGNSASPDAGPPTGAKAAKAAPVDGPAQASFKNIVVTEDHDVKTASDTFGPDTPKIYVFFDLDNVSGGDKVRGVWICEKSKTAPPNYKIDEATLNIGVLTNSGYFAMSKPTKGWPEGDYHVDLYINEALKETVKFKVAAPKAG